VTAIPIPHPPAPLRGEEVEKIGCEDKPEKKGGMGARCIEDLIFVSHYPTLILVGNKLISPS